MSRCLPLLALGVFAVFALAACGGDGKGGASGERALKEGETIGKIDRLPGGTAVISGAPTLLAIDCVDDQLTVRTDVDSIVATMDCRQQVPQQTRDLFIGKPVALAYSRQRLRIDSPAAGTLELPAKDARVVRLAP